MRPITYFDIHSHLNFRDFDADREATYERARAAGVGMITVGTDAASSAAAVSLAESHESMWASVGIHPTDASGTDIDKALGEIDRLAAHPKVVAIGECGLDYFHSGPEDMAAQQTMFIRHIELANKVGKPLMLHVRNARSGSADITNAYEEALELLRERARVRANFHFFAGTCDDVRNIIEWGGMVSFTGVLTFTRDYDELVTQVPIDRLMTETDSPFVAPVPHRGKRNEPAHVVDVAAAIARIRSADPEETRERLVQNARDFFGLP